MYLVGRHTKTFKKRKQSGKRGQWSARRKLSRRLESSIFLCIFCCSFYDEDFLTPHFQSFRTNAKMYQNAATTTKSSSAIVVVFLYTIAIFCQYSVSLRNDKKTYYNRRLIGNHIQAFDSYQFRWPWMILNVHNAPIYYHFSMKTDPMS